MEIHVLGKKPIFSKKLIISEMLPAFPLKPLFVPPDIIAIIPLNDYYKNIKELLYKTYASQILYVFQSDTDIISPTNTRPISDQYPS